MGRPSTFLGTACQKCGGMMKYERTGRCVQCTQARIQKAAQTRLNDKPYTALVPDSILRRAFRDLKEENYA